MRTQIVSLPPNINVAHRHNDYRTSDGHLFVCVVFVAMAMHYAVSKLARNVAFTISKTPFLGAKMGYFNLRTGQWSLKEEGKRNGWGRAYTRLEEFVRNEFGLQGHCDYRGDDLVVPVWYRLTIAK